MFNVYSREIADVEPILILKGAAGLSLGMAAKMTAGQLEKAGSTDKPTHIIMGPGKTVDSDVLYPAIRVLPTTIFAAPSSEAVDTVGKVVTLGADALSVTNTDTSGVFTVTYTENKANTVVLGYFA